MDRFCIKVAALTPAEVPEPEASRVGSLSGSIGSFVAQEVQMTHLTFGSTALGRLVLAGPILLAFAVPAAHGQGRSSAMSTRAGYCPRS